MEENHNKTYTIVKSDKTDIVTKGYKNTKQLEINTEEVNAVGQQTNDRTVAYHHGNKMWRGKQ